MLPLWGLGKIMHGKFISVLLLFYLLFSCRFWTTHEEASSSGGRGSPLLVRGKRALAGLRPSLTKLLAPVAIVSALIASLPEAPGPRPPAYLPFCRPGYISGNWLPLYRGLEPPPPTSWVSFINFLLSCLFVWNTGSVHPLQWLVIYSCMEAPHVSV